MFTLSQVLADDCLALHTKGRRAEILFNPARYGERYESRAPFITRNGF